MKPEEFKPDIALLNQLQGHLSRTKGVDILLDIVKNLANALGVEVTCKIVGEHDRGIDEQALRQLIPQLTTVAAAITLRSQIDPRQELRKQHVTKTQGTEANRQTRTPIASAKVEEETARGAEVQNASRDQTEVDS